MSDALVWRMAHRRTGRRTQRDGRQFRVLRFEDSREPPKYGRVFSKRASKKSLRLYVDYERGVKQSNKEQTVKRYVVSMAELLQKHIRGCLPRTVFDASSLEENTLREALARHAQC